MKIMILRSIKFEEKRFWVDDNDIQFAFAYLYCQLKDDEFFKEKKGLLNNIYENSRNSFFIVMHLRIKENLNEKEILSFGQKLISIVFNLRGIKNKDILVTELCNYSEYKDIESLPKRISKSSLMELLVEVGYLLMGYI